MKKLPLIIVLCSMSLIAASSSNLLEQDASEEMTEVQDRDLEAQQQDLEALGEDNPFYSLSIFFREVEYTAAQNAPRGTFYAYAFLIEFPEEEHENERYWKHFEARSIPRGFTTALERLMAAKPHAYRELFDKRDGAEIFKQLRSGPPPHATVFTGNITYKNGRLFIDPQPLTKDQIRQIVADHYEWKSMTCHVTVLVFGFCGFIAFIMGYALYSGT